MAMTMVMTITTMKHLNLFLTLVTTLLAVSSSFSVTAFSPSMGVSVPSSPSQWRLNRLPSTTNIVLHASSTSSTVEVSSSKVSTSSYSTSPSLPLEGEGEGEDGTSTSASTSRSTTSNSSSKSKSKGMTSLHFRGEKVYKSDPVPIIHTNSNDLASFFADTEVRSLLLNGDREDSIEIVPRKEVDDNMINLWIQQCEIVGGLRPSLDDADDVDGVDGVDDVDADAIFRVNTGKMNFSGLKISSNSLIGVKYLKDGDIINSENNNDDNNDANNDNKPEYQLVFIKDSPIVQGPRILVWIYNQLTGSNKNKNVNKTAAKDGSDTNTDENEKEQTVRAFSRFTYETTPDGKSLIFSVESKLEVVIKFPSLLLKIMPVSKEKAEEQGSESVLKAMGKDIEAVLPKVRDYYLKTFE